LIVALARAVDNRSPPRRRSQNAAENTQRMMQRLLVRITEMQKIRSLRGELASVGRQ